MINLAARSLCVSSTAQHKGMTHHTTLRPARRHMVQINMYEILNLSLIILLFFTNICQEKSKMYQRFRYQIGCPQRDYYWMHLILFSILFFYHPCHSHNYTIYIYSTGVISNPVHFVSSFGVNPSSFIIICIFVRVFN